MCVSRESVLYVSLRPPRCYVLTQRVHHGVSGLTVGGIFALCLRGRYRFASIPLLMWGLSDYRDARVWLKRERIGL